MRRFWGIGLAATVLAGATAGAQGVLYNGNGNGHGQFINSWAFSTTPKAEYFTLPGVSTVTGASVSGYALGFPSGSFVTEPYLSGFAWSVYSDYGAGVPGAAIASGNATPTFNPTSTGDMWMFSLPNLGLNGNTGYWLSIALTQPLAQDIYAYWQAGFETGPAGAYWNGTQWVALHPLDTSDAAYGNRLSLNVYGVAGTTPEPGSLALLGTGLVGLTPLVRRRRR